RAVLARGVYGRSHPLLRSQVRCRPSGDLELRVTRVIAAGNPIAVGEELAALGVDQHGPERFVSGLERFSCQVDAAAKESAVIVIEIGRSEEHTSELQSRFDLVCRLLLEKKKNEDKNE